ncbi:MAG: TniB family NTP-binding protein [Gloeomargarita sp. SKYG98]|nr:TniB family NTP-binding protein [Gloeomargarita sp. SKYG98]
MMAVAIDVEQEIGRLQRLQVVELERVRALHQWLDQRRLCRQPGRLLGESRTGKTCGVRSYAQQHPPRQRGGQRPVVPVLYLQVPPECGAKELHSGLLDALSFRASRGTTSSLRQQAYRVLQDCQVEMLILDEADRLKPKCFAEVRDIFDRLGIAVILVGTDRLDVVINRDEQVKNRFLAQFRMGVLNPVEFEQAVGIWEAQILRLPSPSNLTRKETLKLLREKTGGYIGKLDMLLRDAAIWALRKGLTRIDLDTLKEVAAGYG